MNDTFFCKQERKLFLYKIFANTPNTVNSVELFFITVSYCLSQKSAQNFFIYSLKITTLFSSLISQGKKFHTFAIADTKVPEESWGGSMPIVVLLVILPCCTLLTSSPSTCLLFPGPRLHQAALETACRLISSTLFCCVSSRSLCSDQCLLAGPKTILIARFCNFCSFAIVLSIELPSTIDVDGSVYISIAYISFDVNTGVTSLRSTCFGK